MKTNEVKACVIRQLRRLQVLPEPQRRAELAELRRGVGRQPGDLPALWGALLADMPEQLQGSNGPSKAEWAVYTALTLFALHQRSSVGFILPNRSSQPSGLPMKAEVPPETLKNQLDFQLEYATSLGRSVGSNGFKISS